ncbi:MAG: hypothetical protein IJV27_07830 [Prevotella sp.]|nr:hypothetical protein [Prevotella sp.]
MKKIIPIAISALLIISGCIQNTKKEIILEEEAYDPHYDEPYEYIKRGDSIVPLYRSDELHPEYIPVGEDSMRILVVDGNNKIIDDTIYHIKDLP